MKGAKEPDESIVLPGVRKFVKDHIDDVDRLLQRAMAVSLNALLSSKHTYATDGNCNYSHGIVPVTLKWAICTIIR